MTLSDNQIGQLLDWFVTSSITRSQQIGARRNSYAANHVWLQPAVIKGMPDADLARRFSEYYRAGGGRQTLVQIYRDRIEDIIYFDDSAGYVVARNGENVTIRGIELQADIKPTDVSRVLFSYAHTKIISDDIDQKYSETAPTESFSLLVSNRFANKLNASLMFYHAFQTNGEIRLAETVVEPAAKQFLAESRVDERLAEWRGESSGEHVVENFVGERDFRIDRLAQ